MIDIEIEKHRLEPVDTVFKAECAKCGGLRNCDVRGSHDKRYTDDDRGVWSNTTWYVLECRGCEHVFVQTRYIFSEDFTHGNEQAGSPDGSYNETLDYWPALSKRPHPDWLKQYNIVMNDGDELSNALAEVYVALNSGLRMLSAIGIRTCFDIASKKLEVDPSLPFAAKLDGLVKSNHIREADRSSLDIAVDAGNAAAHRGWKPTAADLDTVMTVLETFLHDVFEQPSKSKDRNMAIAKIGETLPPRQLRRKPEAKHLATLNPVSA